MSFDSEFEARAAAIDAQARALEACADPAARSAFQDLLRSVMELHRDGLARMLGILAQRPKGAPITIEDLMADPVIHSLLLLHDLHPHDLSTRVQRALEQLGPKLQNQGARAKLISTLDGTVTVLLEGASAGRLQPQVENVLLDAAPDARIVVETATHWNASFVPVHALDAHALDPASAVSATGSGD